MTEPTLFDSLAFVDRIESLIKDSAISIMKITGHKTEKEFMKYIKASEEETALELMNHPYFSRKKM